MSKRAETDERVGNAKGETLGTLSPDPWDLVALMPIPVDDFERWGPMITGPQPGLGPGVGAQVASPQSPVLRPGR